MASKIDTPTKRKKLKPRKEPYWHKIAKGQYLGFRRLAMEGTWHARIRRPDGKQEYEPLREISEIPTAFEEAFKQAQKWISRIEYVEDYRYTVRSCVDDYVAHLRVENGEGSATAVKQRLEKHLIPALGKVELVKLTTPQVKRWRDGLVRVSDDPEDMRKSKDGANRLLSIAKAAFNLAYRNGLVNTDLAWKRVPSFEDVGQSRKLFLTSEQVNRLLESVQGCFYDLLKAAILTGARYGELVNVKVCDLDQFNGALHLKGKTGARDCHLSNDALAFLKSLTKDKLSDAFLLARDDGFPWGKSHQQRPMKKAVQAAKLPRETVFYSIRHYHISRALLAGVPAQIVAENCGTSIRMLEKYYGKFMRADRREMMNQVELGIG